ncbi:MULTISPECIES: hypothetical protein [unclassified Rathayibacter]|uniref:hypothetical protein n=1 Tax=unclassified Rathayibacter TaxID=2609250 RepID=UPI001C209202|nr:MULTISPECIES: hypothetical protein [unclassified Rathayibacter]
MRRRPDSLRPRHGAGTPVTAAAAAALALTVGLLGTTSAAHAAATPPASTTPSATPSTSVTVRAAAFSGAARGELVLAPGEEPRVGTQVKWTVTVANTGDVPLDDVARTLVGPGVHLDPGQTLEPVSSKTLTQKQLTEGFAVLDEVAGARTPDGVSVYARVRGRLDIPRPTPTPTPTPTKTPTKSPTPTPTGSPTSRPTPTGSPTPTPTSPAPTPTTPATTPTTPAPSPTPPSPTPSPVPVTPASAPSPGASAVVAPAGQTGSTGSTGSPAKVSAATETARHRLASTGYDAATALPAAGILTALGALGMLLGRHRNRPTTARTGR